MSFNREQLPDPVAYFESEGLVLQKGKAWRTTTCTFHGGSDSMRVNVKTGAWVCMSCGEKGGDVLAYEMQAHGLEFVDACKAIGAWVDDGKTPSFESKPTPLAPRAALSVISFELTVVAMTLCDLAKGKTPSETDKNRMLQAIGRVNGIVGAFQ